MKSHAVLAAAALCLVCTFEPLHAQATRNAGTRQHRESEQKTVNKRPIMISPNINMAYLTGGVSDDIREAWRRITPGVGVGADYAVTPWLRLGLRTDVVWCWPVKVNDAIVRMWSYGATATWIFRPDGNSSLYLRGEAGRASLNATERADDDGGVHSLWRIGIGLQSFTGFTRALREEVYFRVIETEDQAAGIFAFSEPLPYNLKQFGFEFTFAFGL